MHILHLTTHIHLLIRRCVPSVSLPTSVLITQNERLQCVPSDVYRYTLLPSTLRWTYSYLGLYHCLIVLLMMAIQVMICSTTQNVLISATLSAFLLLSNAFVPIALHQYFHIFIWLDTLYTVHRSLYVPVNPCLSCVLSMYLPTILMVSVYSVRSLR